MLAGHAEPAAPAASVLLCPPLLDSCKDRVSMVSCPWTAREHEGTSAMLSMLQGGCKPSAPALLGSEGLTQRCAAGLRMAQRLCQATKLNLQVLEPRLIRSPVQGSSVSLAVQLLEPGLTCVRACALYPPRALVPPAAGWRPALHAPVPIASAALPAWRSAPAAAALLVVPQLPCAGLLGLPCTSNLLGNQENAWNEHKGALEGTSPGTPG